MGWKTELLGWVGFPVLAVLCLLMVIVLRLMALVADIWWEMRETFR